MLAIDYPTYVAYCAARKAQRLNVIPESLWNALKTDS